MTRVPFVDAMLAALAAVAVILAAARTRAASHASPVIFDGGPVAPTPAAVAANVPRGQPFHRSPFRVLATAPIPEVLDSQSTQAVERPTARAIGVKAIVGGPPWSALLTGLNAPRSERVVRPGDQVDSLRVLAIEAGHITLAKADSTWTVSLALRHQ